MMVMVIIRINHNYEKDCDNDEDDPDNKEEESQRTTIYAYLMVVWWEISLGVAASQAQEDHDDGHQNKEQTGGHLV